MTSIYKSINKLGYLLVGYSAIKIFGAETAIILCRLIDEANYAKKNSEICYNCFLADVESMAQLLNFSVDAIINGITTLTKSRCVSVWNTTTESSYVVRIEEAEIQKIIRTKERSEHFTTWDYGLNDIQTLRNRDCNYCNSTEKLRELVYSYEDRIPEVAFVLCDIAIKKFEQKSGKSFWGTKGDIISNMIDENEFDADELYDLIYNQTQDLKN